MTASARVRSAYAVALHEHMRSPTEGHLQVAYEIGRSAVSDNVGIVEMALFHHELLAESASAGGSLEPDDVTRAGQFLSEALVAYEMIARGYHEVRDAVALERRHAAMIRQLASFMGDASLAVHSRDAAHEIIRLVAEHARELTDASSATVEVAGPDNRPLVEIVDEGPAPAALVDRTASRHADGARRPRDRDHHNHWQARSPIHGNRRRGARPSRTDGIRGARTHSPLSAAARPQVTTTGPTERF